MEPANYYTGAVIAEARKLLEEGHTDKAFEALAEPLHEALYQRQDFKLLEELPTIQRLILAFDYVQSQVVQGGFIQLIQNGYISLLVTTVEAMQELGIGAPMVPVLDDVIKVFVLNVDALSKETSVEEFSKLYAEFQEFEPLEKKYLDLLPVVKQGVINRALQV